MNTLAKSNRPILVSILLSSAAAALASGAATVHAQVAATTSAHINRYDTFFLSVPDGNQVLQFDRATGQLLGTAPGATPAASNIGYGGDLFVGGANSDILRYDGVTGAYKGEFIATGAGGLVSPNSPAFCTTDNLTYVDDITTNSILRYDENGKFVDVFATADSGIDHPRMADFDLTTIFLANTNTNSVLRWDLATKAFLGAFIPPRSGGLDAPIGLVIGPDQNLYIGSNGTNEILRYDGRTGAFIDAFVPAGAAGMSNIKSINFGGPNTNLYVNSSGSDRVLEFDRVTGAFVRVVADTGPVPMRGLTLSARPILHAYAKVASRYPDTENGRAQKGGDERGACGCSQWEHIAVDRIVKDFTDPSLRVRLMSIVSSDPHVNVERAVRGAEYGRADWDFDLAMCNTTGTPQKYTIMYTATNSRGLSTISTTVVDVPAQ